MALGKKKKNIHSMKKECCQDRRAQENQVLLSFPAMVLTKKELSSHLELVPESLLHVLLSPKIPPFIYFL